MAERLATLSAMENSIIVCGRTFTAQLIQHLKEMLVEQPHISHTPLAREACERLLWASTGTKSPDYSDVKCVTALIGPDTVK